MSAAASADMIETPPVLNFEEIDYKEMTVEEVRAGPGAGPAGKGRPPAFAPLGERERVGESLRAGAGRWQGVRPKCPGGGLGEKWSKGGGHPK